MRAAETAAEASAGAAAHATALSLPDDRLPPFPAQQLLDAMAASLQVSPYLSILMSP